MSDSDTLGPDGGRAQPPAYSISIDSPSGEKLLELRVGDLARLPAKEASDLLVVSAFPDDYLPTPGSLIGALAEEGISVAELAKNKEEDLRRFTSCWLSKKLPKGGTGFKRILCFEPTVRGRPPEVVGDIFRAIISLVEGTDEYDSVAMPVVAAGDQKAPLEDILPPLLDAASRWLQLGLNIRRLSVYVRGQSEVERALPHFRAADSTPISSSHLDQARYDVFISYSHRDAEAVSHVSQAITTLRPDTRIFIDRQELVNGMPWQQHIYEAIDASQKVMTLLSEDYLQSEMCKEEYNIAKLRAREARSDILFPVLLRSTPLPSYMKLVQWEDCREADESKLDAAVRQLVESLTSS